MGHPCETRPVTEPSAGDPRSHRRRVLLSSLVAFALFGAVLVLGLPLRTDAAPFGIVSLQFAASPAAAERMLASWSAVPRARLLWAHGLDLVLPFAYAIAIAGAARRFAAMARRGRALAAFAAGAAITAAVADQVENIAMGFTILAGASWPSVLITLVAAIAKSTMLVVAIGATAGVARSARRGRSSRR